MLLLLAACIDNNLTGKDPNTAGFDTDSPFTLDSDSGQTSVTEEECNGVDDDGDGEVDEGFEDADGNGRVDCLDASCPATEPPTGGAVSVDEECAGVVYTVANPWDLALEWRYTTTSYGVEMLPAVGNLTDDNGDGLVNGDDIPDIAYGVYQHDEVGILSGDGSGRHWALTGMNPLDNPIIADLDADGQNEIVFFTTGGYAQAYDGDGNVKWTAAATEPQGYPAPVACDLDADGLPELITGSNVLNGEDGTLEFTLPPSGLYTVPTCMDIDLDGAPEIVLGSSVYSSTGTRLFSVGSFGIGLMPAVMQADADPEGELVFVGDSAGVVVDTDGTQLVRFTIDGSLTGPPCVADFDGDGASEFVVPSNTTLALMEADGTQDWKIVTGDGSGFAGCSAFDVDGDGRHELLFAGETKFRIFDGPTGATLYESTDHNSVTVYEYPVVADVDHDGAAEVVIVENSNGGGTYGLSVYGQVDNTWPPAGPTWGVHDFSETNQDEDGGIPTDATTPWLDFGVFRGRPASRDLAASADLVPRIVDSCIADCTYGPVQVTVQVENIGGADADAGATLELYAVDGMGERLVWSTVLPAVPTGTSLDAVVVDVPIADRGDGRWRLAVDTADTVGECDEDNSTAWNDLTCP